MTDNTGNVWDGIIALIKEIKNCEKAGAIAASVAMAYICIDVMSMLSLPDGRSTQTRQDFVDWVDTYLKGHPDQPYQYRGIDVYGARCAMVHARAQKQNFTQKIQMPVGSDITTEASMATIPMSTRRWWSSAPPHS